MGLTLILTIPTPDVSIYLHHEEQTMQHMKLKLAAAITAALLSTNAMADAWDVAQTSTVEDSTEVKQQGATAGALQALNAVSSTTATIKGTQDVNMGANKLTLTQGGTTGTSTQAANYISAAALDSTNPVASATANVTQKSSGSGAIELNQKDTAAVAGPPAVDAATLGASNTQAFNMVKGHTVDKLEQLVTSSSTAINLNQETTTGSSGGSPTANNNTQTLNNVETDTELGASVASVKQKASSAGTITLSQKGAGIKQVQAVNRISAKTVTGTVLQDIQGELSLTQGDAAGPTIGAGSVQAGNYLVSPGSVSGVTQTIGTSGTSKDVTLTQNYSNGDATNGAIIQAGNLIDSSAAGALLASTTQNLYTDGELTLAQASTGKALQAGNAVLTGNSATTNAVTQNFGVTTLAMSQTGASGSRQAANYVGVAP